MEPPVPEHKAVQLDDLAGGGDEPDLQKAQQGQHQTKHK